MAFRHNNGKSNTTIVNEEVKNLLAVMQQKEMRRYKTFLFSTYNRRTIYVSIREFVWTHTSVPFLAERTAELFQEILVQRESDTEVDINVTDFTVTPDEYLKTPNYDINALLCHTLEEIFEAVDDKTYSAHCNADLKEVACIKYRHPGETKMRRSTNFELTLGDLGFTDGSVLQILPSAKEN